MSVKRLQALAACATVFLALSSPAQAYLDPGTGSYVLQVLAAALFASLFALRLFLGSRQGLLLRALFQEGPGQAMTATPVAASFRDPSGFVFRSPEGVFRQVNRSCAEDYDLLMGSGLYDDLAGAGLLIPHEESGQAPPEPDLCHKVIRPEQLGFMSHPYEWCFGQLRDAALATLDIHRRALDKGMVLKDASAYNIQFVHGRPLFIDTLSFAKYREGEPWVAYRQFCQHFLAPLLLMAKRDVRLNKLLADFIDGVPLDMASALLPRSTRFRPSILLHIHMHAKSQKKYSDKTAPGKGKGPSSGVSRGVSKRALLGMADNLAGLVRKLSWEPSGTEWVDLLPGHQLRPGRHRGQAPPGRGLPGQGRAQDGLGPGRQHRRLQPVGRPARGRGGGLRRGLRARWRPTTAA